MGVARLVCRGGAVQHVVFGARVVGVGLHVLVAKITLGLEAAA